MTESRFTKLLWLYVALSAAWLAAALVPTYSTTLAQAYENEPNTSLFGNAFVAGIVLIPLLIAWVVGLVGLFLFKRWARSLSLCITLVGLVITVFLGPHLSSGLELALYEASTVLWGAILAVSYFSAVSARFER